MRLLDFIARLVFGIASIFLILLAGALMVTPGAIPVLGDILRYTISPVFGWLTMPLMKRAMFAPAPVT